MDLSNNNKDYFKTTRWTLISQMRDLGSESAKSLRNELFRDYWQPIYSYIFRRCHRPEQASDLTQEFFAKCIIENNLFEKAARERGKFRSLLITSLKRFLVSEIRHNNTTTRRPENKLRSLDDMVNAQNIIAPPSDLSEEETFNFSWIQTILSNVTTRLEEHYRRTNKSSYWIAFNMRLLDPILKNQPPATLPEIVKATGIETEAQISNILLTVKRKFRIELRNHIREYANNENEVNEEITEFSLFLKKIMQDS